MRAPGLLAVVRRELSFLRKSVAEQFLWLWSPLLALGTILWLFSSGVPSALPIVVVDQDHSASSRELVRRIGAVRSLNVAVRATSLEEAWPFVRRGEAYGVVQVPAGWALERLRGGQKPVVLYNNTQYYLIAGLLSSGVREAVSSLAGEQAVLREARFGGGFVSARLRAGAVRAELRTLFNPQISYELYLGGMLAPIMLHLYITIMGISLLGREFRDCTAGEWLAAAGGRVSSALLGKCLVPFGLYLLFGAVLVAMFSRLGGGLALAHQALWLAGLAMMFLASLALALLLVSLTGNLRICLSSAGVLVATSPAFSGFTFPLEAMGDFGRSWGLVLPITHYLQLQQGQWMSGASLASWAGQMLRLAAFTGGFLAIGLPMMLKQIHDPKRWGRR